MWSTNGNGKKSRVRTLKSIRVRILVGVKFPFSCISKQDDKQGFLVVHLSFFKQVSSGIILPRWTSGTRKNPSDSLIFGDDLDNIFRNID